MNRFLAATAALLGGLTLAGSASAAVVYDVTVWTGTPNGVASSQTADNAHTPTSTPDVHFSYTGPLNWTDNAPQNQAPTGDLFKNFINATDQAFISGWSSPDGAYANQAAWLNASMSIAGNAYTTFFKIIGTYTSAAPSVSSIRHDDGASVYDFNGAPLYLSPPETTAITGAFTLPAGTNQTFRIDYVAGNGTPSILNVSAVPEPATWAMMILGFGMLGAGLRLRRSSAEEATVG